MTISLRIMIRIYLTIVCMLLNLCPFDYTYFAVIWKVGNPVNWFTHNSLMSVVTSTDYPKSVSNRFPIEHAYWWRFCVVSCFS